MENIKIENHDGSNTQIIYIDGWSISMPYLHMKVRAKDINLVRTFNCEPVVNISINGIKYTGKESYIAKDGLFTMPIREENQIRTETK